MINSAIDLIIGYFFRPKIYISGKITGLTEEEYMKMFQDAEDLLKECGFKVINPCKLNHTKHDKSWKSYMLVDLKALKPCLYIYMLENWQDSRGARIEHWLSKRYNRKIIHEV